MKPEKPHTSSGKQRRRKESSATTRLRHPLQTIAQRKRVAPSFTRTRISRTMSSEAAMMAAYLLA
jgi:hypothetical protein